MPGKMNDIEWSHNSLPRLVLFRRHSSGKKVPFLFREKKENYEMEEFLLYRSLFNGGGGGETFVTAVGLG